MRCSKYQIIWYWWTVYSQIWKRTNRNCIIFNEFLFPFLSHLSSFSVKSLPLFFLKLRSYPLSYFLLSPLLLFLSASPSQHITAFPLILFFFFAVIWWVGWAMGRLGHWCVGSDGVGWVRFRRWWVGSDGWMGGWVVDGLGCRWIRLS